MKRMSGICVVLRGGYRTGLDFIKYILTCVLKMKVLRGLGQHEGE